MVFLPLPLKVRPVYHRTAKRVPAHVPPCMLAHYVEWHMRRWLVRLLFDDEDWAGGEAARTSAVASARLSESARRLVHSFRTLLGDPAAVTKNRVALRPPGAEPFSLLTRLSEQ